MEPTPVPPVVTLPNSYLAPLDYNQALQEWSNGDKECHFYRSLVLNVYIYQNDLLVKVQIARSLVKDHIWQASGGIQGGIFNKFPSTASENH